MKTTHRNDPANGERPTTQSYLLRIWCAGAASAALWRASLESTRTGERIGFATLEHLFAFLMTQSEQNQLRLQGQQGAENENSDSQSALHSDQP